MKFDSKKIAASAMAATMIMSMTGCSLLGGGKAKQEVLDAADSFASNLCALKTSKVTGAMADLDDDQIEEIEFGFEAISSDEILSAIASTLAYEIDEDSVEADAKKGEASVDVVFTYVDADAVYEDVIDDDGDEDDFIDALGDSDDVVEVEVTIEFTLDDDEWLVDDAKLKIFEKVFAFCEADYTFTPVVSAALVSDSSRWYYTDSDNYYSATSSIEYDIIPVDEAQDIEWNFYYEIYYNGGLVYTSDDCVDQGYWIEAYFGTTYNGATEEDGYLAPGDYRCVMYTLDGDVLADATCEVAAATVSGGSTGTISDIAYAWENGINAYWYTYATGGDSMAEGIYDVSETTIEYTCQVIDENTFADFPMYYEVYYSATGSTDDAEFIYSNTIYPTSYSNGYFYEFQYNGTLEEGSYFFAGAQDANSDAVFVAEATVS